MKKTLLACLLGACALVPASAQDRIVVAAARSLEATGFLAYIGPIARAQAGVDIQWIPAETAEVIQLARECGVDAILVSDPDGEVRLVRDGVGALRLRVMTAGPEQFDAIAVNPGVCPPTRLDAALKFLRWITSEAGQKAISDFSPGAASYRPNAGSETCPTCEAQQ